MFSHPLFHVVILALALLLISNLQLGVSGVQIQFRGQKIEENEDSEKVDTHPGLQEAIVKIGGFDGISSSSGVRRNEIVENFFADIASETCKTNSTVASEDLTQDIRARANGIYDFLVHSRRFLHKHPELMYQEEISSAWVQKVLSDLDIKFTKGWAVNSHPDIIKGPGGYGVVADIGTDTTRHTNHAHTAHAGKHTELRPRKVYKPD